MKRVDAYPLAFSVPAKVMTFNQVVHHHAGIIGKTEFPQGNLDFGFLRIARVEVDRDQERVVTVWRGTPKIQNLLVAGLVEGGAELAHEGRIGAADVVQLRDFLDDVARRCEIALTQLILLGVHELFLAWDRFALAQFEAAVDTP